MLVTLKWALGRRNWIRIADSTNLSFIPLSPFPLLIFLFCILPLIETECHVDILLEHISQVLYRLYLYLHNLSCS